MGLAILLLLGAGFLLFLGRGLGVSHPKIEITNIGLACVTLALLLTRSVA